jgi:hypothetical protein
MVSRYWPMSGQKHGPSNCLLRVGTTAVFAVSLTFAGLTAAAPALAGTTPANDDFASATTLTGSDGNVSSDNIGATPQTGEPEVVNDGGQDATVWYSWTPDVSASTTFYTCYTPNVDPPAMDGCWASTRAPPWMA